MNDTQNTAASFNSQLGAGSSNSPQSTGGEGLSEVAGNLQTVSTPNLFSGTESVSITQVGDANFTPYTPDNTTTASVAPVTAKPVDHHYPIIAGAAVCIVVVFVLTWLMSRKQKAY